MIRMPLFFFVSGFLLDKPGIRWGMKDVLPFIGKKAKVQLVPTIVFMLGFCYLFDKSVEGCLMHNMKYGYWFTITLFQFFIFYSPCKMLPVRFQYKALLGMSFLLFVVLHYTKNLPFFSAFQLDKVPYFLYFIFGAYVKSHFKSFTAFLEGKYFSLVVVAFFVVALMRIKDGFLIDMPFQTIFLGIAGICIVFNFFRKYEASFQQTTVLGRMLQYVGRRTLDVYLLHYFFLPRHLEMVGDFFGAHFNPSLEFVCEFLLSIIVVGLALLMSNVIRMSETLAHWLFGVKRSNIKIEEQ